MRPDEDSDHIRIRFSQAAEGTPDCGRVVKPDKFPSVRILTSALIDTGCSVSALAPRDILKTRISPDTLPSASPNFIRLGGFNFPLRDLGDVHMIFIDDAGDKVQMKTQMKVLGLPSKREGIEHIPTIIGTDFLEDSGLTAVFNFSRREGYLEL